nr:hypothetical protein [Mycobacteroides abscessus]
MAINFDRVVVQIIAGAGFGVAAMVLSPHATAALEIGGQYSTEDGAGGSGKGALIGGPAAGAAPVAGVPILPGAAAPLDGAVAAGPVGGKGAPVGATVPGGPTPGVPTPAGPQG